MKFVNVKGRYNEEEKGKKKYAIIIRGLPKVTAEWKIWRKNRPGRGN